MLVGGLNGCKKIDLNRLAGTWSSDYRHFVRIRL